QSQRKLIQPAFRHENIVSYAQIITRAAAAMLSGWQPGELRDIHAEMMTLTLEIVAKSLFGSDVSGEARGVGEAMSVVMDLFITQANWAFILPDRVPIPKSKRLRESIKHLDDVVYRLIRARRASTAAGGAKASAPGADLLTTLLAMQDETGGRM